jgi:hypothetical protein
LARDRSTTVAGYHHRRPACSVLPLLSGDAGSAVLTTKLHKLAALRLLSDGLGQLEEQRQERIGRGDNPVEVDREVAQMALNGVVTFLLDLGIESHPLVRLLSGLAALSADSSPPPMLAPAVTRHRRPGPALHRRDQGQAGRDHGISTDRGIGPESSRRVGCPMHSVEIETSIRCRNASDGG